MQIIKRSGINLLLADEGKMLRATDDVYTPATEKVEEHIPYKTDMVFLPINLTEEQIEEMYIEE